MRRFILAALLTAGAALAGLGDGFGGGSTATAGAGGGATVTYPIANVQVDGSVDIDVLITGGSSSSYSVTDGALPPGLAINASTGKVTGEATTVGLYVATVTATGAGDATLAISVHDGTAGEPHEPDAPAYARPVSCDGTYVLTGATTAATGVTWWSEPGNESGTCTGTTSYSCMIAVSPDAAEEGVATVSIQATTGAESVAVIVQRVGFYVADPVHCYLSQSIDGLNNTTNADNDSVATWVDLGSGGKDLTQPGGSKPTVQEGNGLGGVSIQPVVQFSSQYLDAAAAADWRFLHNGSDVTHESVFMSNTYAATQALYTNNDGVEGACDGVPAKGTCSFLLATNASLFNINPVFSVNPNNIFTAGLYHSQTHILDDDNGAGVDLTAFVDGTSVATGSRSGSYDTDGGRPIRVGRAAGASTPYFFGGKLFRLMFYNRALTSTQRGINKAVDEWALGNSLPVNP